MIGSLGYASQVNAAWFDTDYGFCQKMTIESDQVATTTASFTILATTTQVVLKTIGNGGNVEKGDGIDIIFTDGTDCVSDSGSLLDFETERYIPATGELVSWIRFNDLSSTTDKNLLMYYGNSSATDQSNATATWDSEYGLVMHLSEKDTTAFDSTSNNNDGAFTGDSLISVIGQIGSSTDLAGSADYFDIADNVNDSLDPISNWSYSAWVHPQGGPASGNKLTVLGKGQGGTSQLGYFLGLTDTNYFFWNLFTTGGTYEAGNEFNGTFAMPQDVWTYITYVHTSDGTIKNYVNGVLKDIFTGKGGTVHNSTENLRVGYTLDNNNGFNGILDEVRIHDVIRTFADIKTEYNNQSEMTTFLTFGTEETAPFVEEDEVFQDIVWFY